MALLLDCTIRTEPFERNHSYEAFTGKVTVQPHLNLGKNALLE
jgi:hypothetical protein